MSASASKTIRVQHNTLSGASGIDRKVFSIRTVEVTIWIRSVQDISGFGADLNGSRGTCTISFGPFFIVLLSDNMIHFRPFSDKKRVLQWSTLFLILVTDPYGQAIGLFLLIIILEFEPSLFSDLFSDVSWYLSVV